MKLLRRILAGLAIVIVVLVAVVWGVSSYMLGKRFTIAEAAPPIPTDSAGIARGRHIVRAITKCEGCHGPDMGGEVMADAMPVFRLVSVNLTTGRGGMGAQLTDQQIVNAIRHGVGGDGRALLVMPSDWYRELGDSDVADIVAWIRSLPPVDRQLPLSAVGPVGRALVAVGVIKGAQAATAIDHAAARPAPPAAGATAPYGKYLVDIGLCHVCHGPTLSGGKTDAGPPMPIPPANITPEGLKGYDEAAFVRALRQGIRPSGTSIDTMMPWRMTREMTDDEIKAVWAYLQTVPPRAFGNH